jgi:hypothetical protein
VVKKALTTILSAAALMFAFASESREASPVSEAFSTASERSAVQQPRDRGGRALTHTANALRDDFTRADTDAGLGSADSGQRWDTSVYNFGAVDNTRIVGARYAFRADPLQDIVDGNYRAFATTKVPDLHGISADISFAREDAGQPETAAAILMIGPNRLPIALTPDFLLHFAVKTDRWLLDLVYPGGTMNVATGAHALVDDVVYSIALEQLGAGGIRVLLPDGTLRIFHSDVLAALRAFSSSATWDWPTWEIWQQSPTGRRVRIEGVAADAS